MDMNPARLEIAGFNQVSAKERLSQLRMRVREQIHPEEREILRYVDPAKCRLELHAVEGNMSLHQRDRRYWMRIRIGGATGPPVNRASYRSCRGAASTVSDSRSQ